MNFDAASLELMTRRSAFHVSDSHFGLEIYVGYHTSVIRFPEILARLLDTRESLCGGHTGGVSVFRNGKYRGSGALMSYRTQMIGFISG